MSKPATEEKWYVIPELEIRIHESWVTLVKYCQDSLPYGDIKIEIDDGQPGKRLEEVPSIRFDKQPVPLKEGKVYLVASLDVRIPEYWINFIRWCQTYFVSGIIKFRLASGQPSELLSAKQRVWFSKPETIPAGIPLDFKKT